VSSVGSLARRQKACGPFLGADDGRGRFCLQVIGYVNRVADVDSNVDTANFTLADVESNMVRCPDQEAAEKMIDGKSAQMHHHLLQTQHTWTQTREQSNWQSATSSKSLRKFESCSFAHAEVCCFCSL